MSANTDNDNNRDTFIVEEKPERATLTQENVNDSDFANDNEVPTLRRRQKNIKDQGPRVTRNLADDEVMIRLQELCKSWTPWEEYEKVSRVPRTDQVHL